MQPIRSNDNSTATYTLDTLISQYQEVKPIAKERREVEVSDEEVCIFLNHCHWIWTYAFWIFFFTLSILTLCGFLDG